MKIAPFIPPWPMVDVSSAHLAFKAWMFEHALPFWAGVGHEGVLGWVRRLSRSGEVLDDAADPYDQAFVLFGLGW